MTPKGTLTNHRRNTSPSPCYKHHRDNRADPQVGEPRVPATCCWTVETIVDGILTRTPWVVCEAHCPLCAKKARAAA